MASDASKPLLIAGWEGSDRGRDALALARVLAQERDARVVVAYAHPDYSHYPLAWEASEAVSRETQYALDQVPEELLGGVESERRGVTGFSPAEALQQEAVRLGAEMIVVGSTRHGALGRVVPGSAAENLLHGAPCAVAVAPAGYAQSPPESFRVVEIAFDGSDESAAAVDRAAALARRANAKLRLVAVVDPIGHGWAGVGAGWAYVIGYELDYFEESLAKLADDLAPEVDVETLIREGRPSRELTAEAEQGVDLLVMGSRGYGPVRRVLLGSTSATVLRAAPCPVLVVPRGSFSREESDRESAAATSRS
jgi:nucleotide-binding universal stress UspA family protein